ncbi:3-oxoacyl-ACP synthase III family protein [Actinomadura hibisca]|uniref:3-oxoacyl-ACP synthase III family protein n=1 Tax=Actinomadura hibisca TaxID=68565 RepID=UPI000A06BD74|nr:ketoacyl-ACP synthase III [Actinomadura hibisca]
MTEHPAAPSRHPANRPAHRPPDHLRVRHPWAILGTGSHLPGEPVPSARLSRSLGLADDWIEDRTGIRQRHHAPDGQAASDLAAAAARQALDAAGLRPADIGLIVLGTSTPDELGPSTACRVQALLGAHNAAAFDVAAACTGFVYGLQTAIGWLATRHDTTPHDSSPTIPRNAPHDTPQNAPKPAPHTASRHPAPTTSPTTSPTASSTASPIEPTRAPAPARHALVIGVEVYSRFLDPTDRATAALFGDGAAAAVVGPVPAPYGIASLELGSDGTRADDVLIPAGGSRTPASPATLAARGHTIHMDGRAVRDFITRTLPRLVREGTEPSGLKPADLALVVPHQPNPKLVAAVAADIGLDPGQTVIAGHDVGNIGAASLPYALDRAVRTRGIAPGELVLLAGFGAGLTWGHALICWPP